jgi:D-3-phosphoglycerate dehydrogenase
MDSGKVIAAGLDVLENENLKSYTGNEMEQLLALTSRANVVITPHIAGYSRESLEKMAKVLIFKLDEFQMD